MLKLEDIKKDAQVRGIQAEEIVRVVQVEHGVFLIDAGGHGALTHLVTNSSSALKPIGSTRPICSTR